MSYTNILPNLWLGDYKISICKEFFDVYKIDIVINCTKDHGYYSNKTQNIRIEVDDSLRQHDIDKLYFYFDKTTDFINKNLNRGKNILVHCHAGKQRSANIVLAYLMKYGNMSYKNAKQYLKSKRPICFEPTNNFETAILKYEKDLNLT